VLVLGRCDPQEPNALDMLLKVAKETEDLGRYEDAIAVNRVLVEKFGKDAKTQDSPNVIRRLEQMGKVIENVTGKDLSDKPVDLAQLKGKTVLVDFWGMWCQPCVKSLADLKRLREKFADKGFEILGIITDPELERARAFVTSNQIDWPQISEPITQEI